MDKSSSHTLTILEQSTVCPPPGAVAVQSLPLTFYDFLWLNFRHATRVIFFNFPHSTAYFTENIVPCLKTSLSLALKYYTPLAGKLITPFHGSDSTVDIQIRYLEGHDSLSLTFAECTGGDINHYCGNDVREADILKPLVPELPAPTCIDISGENCYQVPVFALQVTVFPNSAICIGMTNSHAAADGRSIFDFVKTWATIAKQLVDVSGAAEEVDTNELASSGCIQIPNYDRSLIRDPYGLGDMFKKTLRSTAGGTSSKQQQQEQVVVSQKKEKKIVHDQDPTSDIIKVRATFVITEANIQALKKIVSTKRPTITYLSTFTVACAYLWTCFAKTRATVYKEAHKLDEAQNFGFVMDCRARLDPPLPASYFGNCLVYCLGVVTGRVMIGDEGLATAAEALGNSIYVKIKEGALHGSDKWLEQFAGVMRGEWHVGVAGSPKLDYYNNIDFGWGKPIKFEFVEGISISMCKDSKTDLEIGIVLPKKEMDVFSTVFVQGLQNLQS